MTNEEQLQQYLLEFNQEIRSLVESEDGSSVEEKATEYMTSILANAGETECPIVCTEIKHDAGRRVLHKLNGYSVSEDEETIDAFVTWFEEKNELRSFTKANAEQAANQTEKFFNSVFKLYTQELDPSAPIYHFAYRLGLLEVRKKIIRLRVIVLTNARYSVSALIPDRRIGDIMVQYHIWDLERFFRLQSSLSNREPIEIMLDIEHGGALPCLAMPMANQDYQSFLAILPGTLLASIYEKYGSRLLEQNVRSFLQFRNKINKGIRNTIKTEPHKFLAYNNGIAATAASVQLHSDQKGLSIVSIKDLQIVNGGQTTAAIYKTQRLDKANLGQVFVQMKLTVIKQQDELETMVPQISKFANSQNAIKEADLSANHPFNIALEQLSRIIYTPAQSGSTLQTRWFFERARGQYKVALNRELTVVNKRVFEVKNPKYQLFTKEGMAKALNSWHCLPYQVARGAQKNYAFFISDLKRGQLPDSIFFEDLVALLLLQKDADRLYGKGVNKLGDLKFLTVPYTLSLLNYFSKGKIDLGKIWKNQSVSDATISTIQLLLPLVENYIKISSEGRLVGEYAKRTECWDNLISYFGSYQLPVDLLVELANSESKVERVAKAQSSISDIERQANVDYIKSLGGQGWKKIEVWGRETSQLSIHRQNLANSIQKAVLNKKSLDDNNIKYGLELLSLVVDNNPSLFLDLNEIVSTDSLQPEVPDNIRFILAKLVMWEKKNKRLKEVEWDFIRKLLASDNAFLEKESNMSLTIIRKAEKWGFCAMI